MGLLLARVLLLADAVTLLVSGYLADPALPSHAHPAGALCLAAGLLLGPLLMLAAGDSERSEKPETTR